MSFILGIEGVPVVFTAFIEHDQDMGGLLLFKDAQQHVSKAIHCANWHSVFAFERGERMESAVDKSITIKNP